MIGPALRRGGAALVSAVLLGSGSAELARGLWIPAKARVAQQLLELAWQRTRPDGAPTRPWPWADTWPVARLHFPTLGESRIVLAGASGESLAFGPGHTQGSALPGHRGTSIVSGHRDTHFALLAELHAGDEVRVERRDGAVARYRIEASQVVDARTTRLLLEEGGAQDELLLVTCWPFDALVPGGPLRLVLTARRLRDTGRAPTPPPRVPPTGPTG